MTARFSGFHSFCNRRMQRCQTPAPYFSRVFWYNCHGGAHNERWEALAAMRYRKLPAKTQCVTTWPPAAQKFKFRHNKTGNSCNNLATFTFEK